MKVFRCAAILAIALVMSSCASKKTDYRVLRHSSYQHPYPEPLKLYIGYERDRSGSDYQGKMEMWELGTFRERFMRGLRRTTIRLETYSSAGHEIKLKLRNPYLVVVDSTEADLFLDLRINAFDESTVEVNTDRLMMWSSYGIMTHQFVAYQRVPRMLVEIDGQMRERGQSVPFYGLQARGISVNRPTKREGFQIAMDRAEIRFYERFLKR